MPKPQVKILSGWSNPGGSTVHHIELTNLFNSSGISCVFYGPHRWHLNKCEGALLDDYSPTPDDILITHFMQVSLEDIEIVKQHILSCHETNLFPLKDFEILPYDFIHFVSNSQKEWHGVDHPSVVIPPVIDRFEWVSPRKNRAGIFGSVDAHKQTHVSILRALESGYEEVYIIGSQTDPKYFEQLITPLLGETVKYFSHMNDRKNMYNKVDAVFHSSERETFNLIKAECNLNGIPYYGLSSADSDGEMLEKKEILEKWKQNLKL